MHVIIRKIIFFSLVILLYYNICFYIFIKEIYSILHFQIYLILLFLFQLIDTMIRPISEKAKADKFTIIVLLLFFLSPILQILNYYENLYIISKHFPFWDNVIISYIGIGVYTLGGIVSIVSRIQLGKFGGGYLVIEEDHKLITNGIYSKIRHPMYSGGLIAVIGAGLVFRTIFLLFSCFLLYFFVFHQLALLYCKYHPIFRTDNLQLQCLLLFSSLKNRK